MRRDRRKERSCTERELITESTKDSRCERNTADWSTALPTSDLAPSPQIQSLTPQCRASVLALGSRVTVPKSIGSSSESWVAKFEGVITMQVAVSVPIRTPMRPLLQHSSRCSRYDASL